MYAQTPQQVGKSTVATTLWSESQKAFVLTLPKSKVIDAKAFAESFRDDLYEEFETPLDAEESTKSAAATLADAAAADAEWTDVTEEPAKKTPVTQPTTRDAVSAASQAQAPRVETELLYLPKAQELARPNDLLSKPPYRITVHARSSAVDILSNHSPSLEMLEAYMTRWCRSDYNYTNKPPIVDLKLHNSPWGLGPMYDRLSMTIPKNSYQVEYISPLMPISMIEGVLGFKETYSDGSTWHFLRTVPFKE
ncbi:hypothetical protein VHEMI08301 [[Torrubiella] hemipterigena]|uniref:Uncharacterized protein n=1 Tax=[Torrubiella] hemipterigena TaxID=1531966 RepID=A0A0A1T6E6_9HYPO|nr:hypothetical protein VHEMI08301 [[Torrubiella] hemipterigena]